MLLGGQQVAEWLHLGPLGTRDGAISLGIHYGFFFNLENTVEVTF